MLSHLCWELDCPPQSIAQPEEDVEREKALGPADILSPPPSGPEGTHPWTSHRGRPVSPLHHSRCSCLMDLRSREWRVYPDGSIALLSREPVLSRVAGSLGALCLSQEPAGA